VAGVVPKHHAQARKPGFRASEFLQVRQTERYLSAVPPPAIVQAELGRIEPVAVIEEITVEIHASPGAEVPFRQMPKSL
jgi:hypothetical protein